MRKIICAVLFFICLLFSPSAWAAEVEVSLPQDAVKTDERRVNVGPTISLMETFETSLSEDKVYAFYKREMPKGAWKELRKGVFSKDNFMAVVMALPVKGQGNKTRFSVNTSRIPTTEEILAQRKAVPDKLDFMPVYPGSEQVFLWDMPNGISAGYETKSEIKNVVFFYKSGMLNYGWNLISESPLTAEAIDCPECRKALGQLPKEAAKASAQGSLSKASLTFRKSTGESCIIRISQNSSVGLAGAVGKLTGMEQQAQSAAENKTAISVTYNANKRIIR